MSFKDHLSQSLRWKWHLQDFEMEALTAETDNLYSALFAPRMRVGMELLGMIRGNQDFVVSTLSSVRLVFLTSIAAAGRMLGKDRKDGEVIAREIAITCAKPLLFTARSLIPVSVMIDIRRRTRDFVLFRSSFSVGAKSEHKGTTTLLYCRPGLTNFSYLKGPAHGESAAVAA